jgi:hypothetical protein
LASAFSFFDKDGSGFITIDELSQACKQFGLSDVHLEDMIKDVDQNNVGFFNTFLSFFPSPHLSITITELDDVNLYVTFRMDKLITASLLQ